MTIAAGPHYNALKILAPKCFAPDGNFNKLLLIKGKHFDDVRTAIATLREEMFEDTCHPLGSGQDESPYGLMEWWEAFYHIYTPAATVAARRLILVAKSREKGGSNKAYFESLAEALGYGIGTHGEVGDPHIRLVDGEYPWLTPQADFARADLAEVYDDGVPGRDRFTNHVYGTDVESDVVLQAMFEAKKVFCTTIIYTNE
jgi:hypothetical protein